MKADIYPHTINDAHINDRLQTWPNVRARNEPGVNSLSVHLQGCVGHYYYGYVEKRKSVWTI